jgi:hypothetical protein
MTPTQWTAYYALGIGLDRREFEALISANPYLFFTVPIVKERMILILQKHGWKAPDALSDVYYQEARGEGLSRMHRSSANFLVLARRQNFINLTVSGDNSGWNTRWKYFQREPHPFTKIKISTHTYAGGDEEHFASPVDFLSAFDEAIRIYRRY